MKKEIAQVINNWDPIGIKNLSPEDEYLYEIEEIEVFLNNTEKVNVETLANEIDRVFKKWFGEEIFVSNGEEIKQVAQEIISICGLEKNRQI